MTNQDKRLKNKEHFTKLLGGKCSRCNSTEYLRFHHVNEDTKSFNVGEGWGRESKSLEEEVAKCILLCASCHRQHHVKFKHGYSAYKENVCKCDICHQMYLKYWEDYRRKNGKPKRQPSQHGTHSKYAHGCRCDECGDAEHDYRFSLRQRNK